jgi:hypothetical protein
MFSADKIFLSVFDSWWIEPEDMVPTDTEAQLFVCVCVCVCVCARAMHVCVQWTQNNLFQGIVLCDCGGWQVKACGQARRLQCFQGVDIVILSLKSMWQAISLEIQQVFAL